MTPTKNSFHKIYNCLHSWLNKCPPNKDEIFIALRANCKIHESHGEMLKVLERTLEYLYCEKTNKKDVSVIQHQIDQIENAIENTKER